MATTSETIYTHTCDLCGHVKDEHDLRHLYDRARDGISQGQQADICGDCESKPVSDVLAFLAEKEKDRSQHRPIRVQMQR